MGKTINVKGQELYGKSLRHLLKSKTYLIYIHMWSFFKKFVFIFSNASLFSLISAITFIISLIII